ncbi:hypothetical protein PRCB_17765 [Pantoea rodasii]|uniref:Uncharacterized protein n=1 Tax=Pantoea rodasii TaxID=1076549 RepID=A0A2M9W9A9_9GAMM|nr:hypothetical protein [Pantoea rodasii]ORM64005.1 hypothetical protein HA45_12905 [Pantoea rodasii]PJZ04123.1 hypothetical protein PRCB_17765 [Pantoea rodasii]
MQRNQIKKLTDIVLGEAVVLLLCREDNLTATSVVARLKKMATDETDPARLEAIALALGELQAEYSQSRESRDAAALAFGTMLPSGSGKKN